MRKVLACQFFRKGGAVAADHGHARIVRKLTFQFLAKLGVEFEKEKFRFRVRALEHLAGMATLAGTVFRHHDGAGKIHLVGNPADHGLRAGHD